MEEVAKSKPRTIVAGLLVAILSGAAFLSLAPREGEANGKGPAEDTLPAQLRIHYEETNTGSGVSKAGKMENSTSWTLDMSAVLEVPKIDYHARNLQGREVLYSFVYDERGLTGSTPYQLISFSGQATYSYQANSVWTRGVDTLEQNSNQQGSGPMGPGNGSFEIWIVGDKILVSAHSGQFPITGDSSWSSYSGASHKSRQGSSPFRQEKFSVGTPRYPWNDTSPDPSWTVNIRWTGSGWAGTVERHTHSTSGVLDEKKEHENLARITFSLDLSGKEQLEAVIIPENDYDQWMPQAGEDEDTLANTLYAAVMLRKKGDKNKAPAQTAQFEVSLVDVSHEPGVSMNWPSQKAVHTPPGPDLKIDKNQSPDLHVERDGQRAKSDPGKREVIVGITSFDWGAYGKLKVIAHVSDGSTLTAYWEGHPDKQELAIPRDDNGNHIADKWEKDNGVFGQGAKSDLDADPPGDSTPGDGLSLYEEYRGFRVEDEGGHIRTDPNRKDLFVVNWNDLPMALFAESGLVVHLVQKYETGLDEQGKDPNPWIINFNHGDFAHLGSEHVLWLVDAQLENGTIGETGDAIIGKGIGPPRSVSAALVRVDRRQCLASKWGQTELMSTVAHELAHGSNVRHHGGVGYRATCMRLLGQAAPDYYTQKYDVSVQGDVNSGDHDCMMRYTGGSELSQAPANDLQGQPLSWLDARNIKARKTKKCPDPSSQNEEWIAGDFYTTHRRQDLPEPPGTTFCKTQNGVPFPKSGNATLGSCVKQFCVNDVTPCKFTGQ